MSAFTAFRTRTSTCKQCGGMTVAKSNKGFVPTHCSPECWKVSRGGSAASVTRRKYMQAGLCLDCLKPFPPEKWGKRQLRKCVPCRETLRVQTKMRSLETEP